MSARSTALPTPSAAALWKWGSGLLTTTLVLALAALGALIWSSPEWLPLVPVALTGLLAASYLFRRPGLNLYVALAGFVLISGYEAGIQVEEVLYGLYFLAVLGHWFVARLYFYRERIVTAPEDGALLAFLVYAVASAGWAVLFGARLGDIPGELLVLAMLAFYFPVKEVCARSPRGARIVLGVIIWFGVFASVRNVLIFREGLSSATQAWQIATGRVALNEVLLMMPALVMLVLTLFARRWRTRLPLLGVFLLFFVGLILTQSRGYWGAFLFGAMVMFVLLDWGRKARILLLVFGGVAGGFLVGSLLFENFFTLIYSGIIERFASLGSALTSDVSLVNRFYEAAAAWKRIRVNPILGYGVGTRYQYFNLTVDSTRVWSFVHNGYVGLWFKFGLIGLGLMLFFWGRSIWNGIKLFRMDRAPRTLRLIGLIAAVCLAAETLVANTSNPFLIADATLMVTLLGALASGCLAYARAHPAADADVL